MPQSLAQIWIHIIFSTKDRQPFLEDPEFREEMFRMLSHHVKESKCISARYWFQKLVGRWWFTNLVINGPIVESCLGASVTSPDCTNGRC